MSRPAAVQPPAPPAPPAPEGWAALDDEQLLEALRVTGVEWEGDRDAAIAALEALDAEPTEDEPAEIEWTIGKGDHVGTLWAGKRGDKPTFNRECSCGDFEGAPVLTVEQADEDFAEHL